jgi:hypothetical protein
MRQDLIVLRQGIWEPSAEVPGPLSHKNEMHFIFMREDCLLLREA